MSFVVTVSGPLFNGQAARAAKEYCDELERVVADQALADAMGIMDASFKNPTPYYETQIIAQPRGEDTVVHDRKIVYGPWLEAALRSYRRGSFQGYHSFRRAAESVRQKVMRLAQATLPTFLRRMG
jgi:hypothetical protein